MVRAVLTFAAAFAQQPLSDQDPTQAIRPEAQCVRDRVEQSRLDVSARLLAAEIADRCSELISAEAERCSETVAADVANREVAVAYCERMLADMRSRRAAALERLAYQLLLVHRQSTNR